MVFFRKNAKREFYIVTRRKEKIRATFFGKRGNPVLLFLHDLGSDSSFFYRLAKELARDFFCVTVDMVGHGGSASVYSYDVTLDSCTDDIEDLVRKLNIEGLSVVSFGSGSVVALELSERLDNITFFFIINPPASAEFLGENERKRIIEEIENSISLTVEEVKLYLSFIKGNKNIKFDKFREFLKDLILFNPSSYLEKIKERTLFIVTPHNTSSESWVNRYRYVRFVLLERCSFTVIDECWFQVAEVIRKELIYKDFDILY